MLTCVVPCIVYAPCAQVEADPNSGLMVVADIRSQLRAQAVVMSSGQHQLAKGDVYTLVLPVIPTKLSEVGMSIGNLKLSWRRRKAGAGGVAGANGLAQHGEHGLLTPRDGDGYEDDMEREEEACSGRSPDALVVTSLELPRVTVCESLLTARCIGPPQATVGIGFTYTLQVCTGHSLLQPDFKTM